MSHDISSKISLDHMIDYSKIRRVGVLFSRSRVLRQGAVRASGAEGGGRGVEYS